MEEIIKEIVQKIIYKIHENESFQVALVSEKLLNSQNEIFVANDNLALILGEDEKTKLPSFLLAEEPTIINSVVFSFDKIWEQIPRVNREKNWVVEKLNLLI